MTSSLRLPTPRPARWQALLIGAAATLLVLATSRDYGFAVDEATYLWVCRQERDWFRETPVLGIRQSLSAEAIARRWHFLEPPFEARDAPHSNFNLPLAHHLMNVGWLASSSFFDELRATRLSSAVLFGICIAAAYFAVGTLHGRCAGAVSASALLLSPRLFAHAHFATTETPLCVFWTLAIFAVERSTRGATTSQTRRWSIGACLLVASAMTVKLTAWIAPAAILIWILVRRPNNWAWLVAGIAILPPAVLLVATPNLWHDPVGSLTRYVSLAMENPWKIASFYRWEGFEGAMPWSSGIVLFAITQPIVVLILGGVGVLASFRDGLAGLLTINLLALLVQRTLNLTPQHDVDRQFLPCFYFLAVLSGIGAAALGRWVWWMSDMPRRSLFLRRSARVAGVFLLVAAIGEPAWETWVYRAHGLSYYNRLIGGLPGAAREGYEISYWYEAAVDDVWKAVSERLPPNSRVFFRPDHPGLDFLREWGLWRPDLRSVGPHEADFMLLYGKRAAYLAPDPSTGKLAATDLLHRQQTDPALVEVRFQGVRLLALTPARSRPARTTP